MIDREVASMAYPGAKVLDSLHHTFLSAASKGANHFYDEHPSQAGARQGHRQEQSNCRVGALPCPYCLRVSTALTQAALSRPAT